MKQTLKRIDLSRVARFLTPGWQRPDLAQRGGGHRGVPFPLFVLLLSVLSPRNDNTSGGSILCNIPPEDFPASMFLPSLEPTMIFAL